MYPRPTSVQPTIDYRLVITFEDGIRAELDFAPMVHQSGVFAQLKNVECFRGVQLDPEAETLVWSNGADICPDVLYHLATSAPLPGRLDDPPAALISREQVELPAGS